MATTQLYELRLPAGDVGGLDIDVQGNTGQQKLWSKDWLSKGYAGIRIIGAGVGVTHMRPNWNGWTLNVFQHPGVVQIENLTLHAGRNAATLIGYENKAHLPLFSKFQFRAVDMACVVDPPTAEFGRTKWAFFGNQSDLYMRNVTIDATLAFEHGSYWHGFAHKGALIDNVKFLGSGAEGFKVRSDKIETVKPAGKQTITLRDCTFKNWYQPWSSRGGAAVVLQGTAADILIERCVAYGGGVSGNISSNARSHAFMISSEPESHDAAPGFGNGHVIIKDSAAQGFSEFDWNNGLVRCASNGGTQQSAQSFTMTRCGMWGEKMQIQLGQIPKDKTIIEGCNTLAIRNYCGSKLGMDVNVEAIYPGSQRKIPISEGVAL